MKDLMLDLETFGTSKNACIVQLGACYFDRRTGQIGQELKMNIDAASNGDIDAATVYWWLGQGGAAIKGIVASPRLSIGEALHRFNLFAAASERIWSHSTFDFPILSEAYKSRGVVPAFTYWGARDIRTLLDLAGVNPKAYVNTGTPHDALDDAKIQVKYCVDAFNILHSDQPVSRREV